MMSTFNAQICFYRPPTNLREGIIFTGVCHSVHRERGLPSHNATGHSDPPQYGKQAGGTHPNGMHTSTSPSKLNISSMVMSKINAEIGSEPVIFVKVCIAIDTILNFDGGTNADVKYEHP